MTVVCSVENRKEKTNRKKNRQTRQEQRKKRAMQNVNNSNRIMMVAFYFSTIERLRKIFASIPEAYLYHELSLIFSQNVIRHSGEA